VRRAVARPFGAEDVEDARFARMAVLQPPGLDEAVAEFARRFPKVAASDRPTYLGTPCGPAELRSRFQALGALVGRESALPLAKGEPLLLVMEEQNLRASWEALVRVAGGDRQAALRVALTHPGCLTAPASTFEGKTLQEFESTGKVMDAFRPVTETLREIGPEGLAVGAAALGVAALGALASRGAKSGPSAGGAKPVKGRGSREAERPTAGE